MAKETGISVDEDVLDDFDDVIWELKQRGELDRDTSRSGVIQSLMEEFVADHRELLDGGNATPAAAD